MTKFFSKNNNLIPSIGLGTWDLRGNVGEKVIEEAIDVGYRHIDTAQMYENEFDVGDGVKQSGVDREDVFITTKLSSTNMNMGQAVESFENSLRKLQTEYVDLLLLHSPPNNPLEVLGELVKLKDQGKILSIGLSNFYGDTLDKVLDEFGAHIITNQIEVHPYVDTKGADKEMWGKDMFVTAYSPLARGRVLEEDVISELAEKYNKTNAQIVLNWLLQKGDLVVIPKSSSVKRLEQNFDVFDFELDSDDVNKIDQLPKDGRIVSGDWLS